MSADNDDQIAAQSPSIYNRYLYAQERLKREDRWIGIRKRFRPDPAAVNLTWKFYSQYRDRCDLCRRPGNALHADTKDDDDVDEGHALNSAGNDVDGAAGGLCCCCHSGACVCIDGNNVGEDSEKASDRTPLERMPEYMELVDKSIRNGPREKYGHLSEPPLSSHDYGWLPADMYTAKYDGFDAALLDRRLKRTNIKT